MRFGLIACIALGLSTGACKGGSDNALFVDAKTDLVPGEEFTGVRIRLERDGTAVATQDTVAVRADDYIAGDRVFEASDLSAGTHRVILELLDGTGTIVATRAAQVQVDGNVGLTILIPRDIRACDPSSCAVGSTCGGAECVDETCSPENPNTCPPPGCVENGDCATRATCSIPVCVSGSCFYASREGACASAEWCNPDEGCLPSTGGDAGMIDGGPIDGGVDSGLCPALMADCDGDMVCELDVSADVRNCGGCGIRCGTGENGTPACRSGACGFDCEPGFEDCDGVEDNGCETTPVDDPLNCGVCGSACPASLPICLDSDCIASPFPSNGSEGAFEPTEDVTLSAGVHHFTTITIPAGVRVTTDGTGVLELRATGDVRIEGVIDVSGGDGIDAVEAIGVGGGGETGTGVAGIRGMGAACPVGAAGGVAGIGGDGDGLCGAGGRSGGGSGGGSTAIGAGAGGGGGGPAGGAGGNRASLIGGAGGSIAGMSSGGALNGEGGEPSAPVPYAGANGGTAVLSLGGGGGGSIGAAAIDDLAMASTFFPGSGGGGGSGVTDGSGAFMGCGGGGGGGALRISSHTSITLALSGSITARGGRGGGMGASRLGAGGGGGSGGAIYIAAPAVSLAGDVDASGGAGGDGFSSANGGLGGIGRIRISALAERCIVSGTTVPPMMGACASTDAEGFVYIAEFPL